MSERKLDFERAVWETSDEGVKYKSFEKDGKRIRLLELEKGSEELSWCETGHVGYVVEGEIEIEFSEETVKYSQGDGLFILPGASEKHIPKPITEKVVLFLVENI